MAFADLTTALAFIFALCTFALSKVLSDITRDERQDSTQSGFQSLIVEKFPNARLQPAGWAKTEYDRRRNLVMMVGDSPVGRISANGSYQRIELTSAFSFGGSLPKDRGGLLALGEVIRTAYLKGDIAYVFLHGIVEEGEAAVAGLADRELARERVDSVYGLWRQNGLISEADRADPGKINSRFVVVYGKEGLYRNEEFRRSGSGRFPGRVDIVLFFTDRAETR
ncbi:hypothetical protein EON77_03110 [bacterium]|nr:MAG: hypothetical protein EON77_03110 [bacterium]